MDPDWAIGYEYAIESTLFLFAEYFAWIRLLQEKLSFELFESQDTKDGFFEVVWDVSNALSYWPDRKVFGEGQDAQVFALQQRAIGELLINREKDAPRVLGYPEFLEACERDPRFGQALAPLRILLEGVSPGTKRWRRLEWTLDALGTLNSHCRQLLAVKGSVADSPTGAAESSSRELPARGSHVDGVLGQLGPHQQDVASGILCCLVTQSGQRISRTVSELAVCTGRVPDELAPVLDELSGRLRILHPLETADDTAARRYEIFDDSVVDALVDWTSRHPSRTPKRGLA